MCIIKITTFYIHIKIVLFILQFNFELFIILFIYGFSCVQMVL